MRGLIRLLAFAVAAMCTASCGDTNLGIRPLPSPDEENAAASARYYDCLRLAQHKYDDGKIAVDMVVSQMSDACRGEYTALKATLSVHVSGEARAKFEADMDANRLTTVRDFVRHERITRQS